MADQNRGVQIIIHSIMAFLLQTVSIFGSNRPIVHRFDALQGCHTIHKALVSLAAGFQRIIAEINRAAIVCLKDKETYSHRRIGFIERIMVAGKELLQGDEVVQTLTHLLAVDCDHVVV